MSRATLRHAPAARRAVPRRPWGPRLGLALVWLGALLWLIPLLGALVTSLRTQDDLTARGFWSVPGALTLGNYASAWTQASIGRYLLNSLIVTLPALAGTLLLSSMAAYALVRYRLRFGRPLYYLFVAGMLLPLQLLLIPVFRLANGLGLYDTLWSLILIHMAFQMAFGVFVLRGFMRTIPGALFESAVIDGAGEWTMYHRIALPLTLPALAALTTLLFTWVFNDYLWSIVLIGNAELRPVTAGVAALMGQYVNDWPQIVAGSLLAALPTVAVFFLLQRYFLSGLTVGATKG